VLGIGLVAIPTGILSSGFMSAMNKKDKRAEKGEEPTYCPYCGKQIKQ
jgi:voltage-gated potassium channel